MMKFISHNDSKVNFIPTKNGKLATYSVGKGRPVIFLHGGPGDTHHYMRRMAEPLTSRFQCIFFDQRGTGHSEILNRTSDDFTLDLLFEDLISVKNHYKCETAALVGHSWGAMYALFSSLKFPSLFPCAALLNMGPLDDEMGAATSQSLLDVLSPNEKENWVKLRKARNVAREEGRQEDVLAADKEMMRLRVKSWVFNPDLREVFLQEYFQYPPPDRDVNKWIWEAIQGWYSWDMLPSAKSDFWVCVGRNDSVPVEQANKIVLLTPESRLTVFEKCGHIPWLEYPDRFYGELTAFLDKQV
jgi:proline iminopeptidase